MVVLLRFIRFIRVVIFIRFIRFIRISIRRFKLLVAVDAVFGWPLPVDLIRYGSPAVVEVVTEAVGEQLVVLTSALMADEFTIVQDDDGWIAAWPCVGVTNSLAKVVGGCDVHGSLLEVDEVNRGGWDDAVDLVGQQVNGDPSLVLSEQLAGLVERVMGVVGVLD
jgi:hypothetical protein